MRALAEALRFLSIIPIPGRPPKRAWSVMAAYPWAGLILGLIAAVAAWGAGWLFGAAGTAVTAVAVRILMTGGLHFDGLADLADGLGGGRDVKKRLLIMADSRLGSFGGLALVVMAALQMAVLADLTAALAAESHPGETVLMGKQLGKLSLTVILPLVVAPSVSRGMIPLMMHLYPSARPGGMGDRNRLAVTPAVVVFTVLSSFTLTIIAYGIPGLGLGLAAALLMIFMAALIAQRLGGLTGDAYGALIETGDLIVFFGILVLTRMGWHQAGWGGILP